MTSTTPPHIGPRSSDAFARARAVFPDGTTRVTVERDPIPRYMSHGDGAYLVDVDGRRFLDLSNNFTTLIHGHAFAPVVAAIERQLRSGTCFANPTEKEIELAALLCARVPLLEHVRFVNTGSEAVMFAIKAARAFTGRSAIAKIEGAYHGAYDWAEVSQHVAPASWGAPEAPASVPYYRGMPQSVLGEVVALRFNDAAGARRRLAERAGDLAAIMLDPMPSRAGLIPPEPAFIAAIQETARAHGILVISDEVLSFRQSHRGAASRYGLAPDLFALGKIIGGGLPIGAVGGSADVMAVFDAQGGRPALPQGGTFSANPLSMTAGLAAMAPLDEAAFARLEQLGDGLRARLAAAIEARQAPFCVTGAASLFRIHPRRRRPREFREAHEGPAQAAAMKALGRFFGEHGIIIPAAATACLSTAMDTAEIDAIVQVFARFLETQSSLFADLS
jgi:glutamate-1-semialdehyde 2,1-aminomutase